MGVKSVDQDVTLVAPFSLSLRWLVEGVPGERRMSNVVVGSDGASTDTSSLSSQRSMTSGEVACGDDLGRGAVFGMLKKEESFDCPALSFFGFDVPVVEVSVRGRLWASRGACGGFREAWFEED